MSDKGYYLICTIGDHTSPAQVYPLNPRFLDLTNAWLDMPHVCPPKYRMLRSTISLLGTQPHTTLGAEVGHVAIERPVFWIFG